MNYKSQIESSRIVLRPRTYGILNIALDFFQIRLSNASMGLTWIQLCTSGLQHSCLVSACTALEFQFTQLLRRMSLEVSLEASNGDDANFDQHSQRLYAILSDNQS